MLHSRSIRRRSMSRPNPSFRQAQAPRGPLHSGSREVRLLAEVGQGRLQSEASQRDRKRRFHRPAPESREPGIPIREPEDHDRGDEREDRFDREDWAGLLDLRPNSFRRIGVEDDVADSKVQVLSSGLRRPDIPTTGRSRHEAFEFASLTCDGPYDGGGQAAGIREGDSSLSLSEFVDAIFESAYEGVRCPGSPGGVTRQTSPRRIGAATAIARDPVLPRGSASASPARGASRPFPRASRGRR